MRRKETEIVLIGGSAGSLQVILQLVRDLAGALPFPIVLILHRKGSESNILVDLLQSRTSRKIVEAEDKMELLPDNIYVVPADYHLLFESKQQLSLDYSEKVRFSRPSIDVTFKSAADVFGAQSTAVLLSGANADGIRGLQCVKQAGGYLVVQDPDSAEVDYMPRQAVEQVDCDLILKPDEIAPFINSINK